MLTYFGLHSVRRTHRIESAASPQEVRKRPPGAHATQRSRSS